jgi:outer membrane protein assembly factor BamB
MPRSYDRRAFLRVGVAGSVVGAAGCLDLEGWRSTDGNEVPGGWPMFQSDPANTGHASDPGPTDGVARRWRNEVGDLPMEFPPTVSGGSVYVAKRYLHALDAETGEQRWQGDLGFQGREDTVQQSVDVRTALAVVDGTVYAAGTFGDHGRVWALSTERGDVHWQFDTEEPIYFTSPTVVEGTVYQCSLDQQLYAIDAGTGEETWRASVGPGRNLRATPAASDGTVYVGTMDISDEDRPARLVALDAASGAEQWTVTVPSDSEGKWAWTTTPVIADDTVFIGAHDRRLRALDAATGEEQWAVESDHVPFVDPLTVADGTLYAPGDGIAAYDPDTGEETWTVDKEQVPSRGLIAATDDTLYVTGDDGHTYAVGADGGETRWRFEIQHGTPPVVADGRVYVVGFNRVQALEEP